MERIAVILAVLGSSSLGGLAVSCARHSGATDGETVTIDRNCDDDAGCAWATHPQVTETPGVADACVRSTERFAARCGVAGADDAKTNRDCKQLALTHGEGAIAWLACRAEASCDAPAAGCEQSSTFGDELCASPAMSCSSYCSDRFRRFLDEIAPRLKPALLAAAKTCASQKRCAEARDCMSAWVALID
jgi:hypothetical protein